MLASASLPAKRVEIDPMTIPAAPLSLRKVFPAGFVWTFIVSTNGGVTIQP